MPLSGRITYLYVTIRILNLHVRTGIAMRKEPILLDLTSDYFCDDKYEAIRIFKKEVIDLRKVTLRQLKRLEEKKIFYSALVNAKLCSDGTITDDEWDTILQIRRARFSSYADYIYARLELLIELIDSRGKNEN